MGDESRAFAATCAVIQDRTELDPAVVRGSVRLALREAGLFDAEVTAAEMAVVTKTLLPGELRAGGVDDAEAVCEAIRARLGTIREDVRDDSPDAVFARLGVTA